MSKRRGSQWPMALGQLLSSVCPKHEFLPGPGVLRWWTYQVPQRVRDHAWPAKLIAGVLTVHTQNSAWANEIDYVRELILQSAHKHVGNKIIKSIRIHVGPIPDGLRYPPQPVEPTPTPNLSTLPDDIARALANISDNETREIIARAALRALKT